MQVAELGSTGSSTGIVVGALVAGSTGSRGSRSRGSTGSRGSTIVAEGEGALV